MLIEGVLPRLGCDLAVVTEDNLPMNHGARFSWCSCMSQVLFIRRVFGTRRFWEKAPEAHRAGMATAVRSLIN